MEKLGFMCLIAIVVLINLYYLGCRFRPNTMRATPMRGCLNRYFWLCLVLLYESEREGGLEGLFLLGILANIPRIRGSEKNKIFGGEEHVKKKN